jgi:hypothetical protein
MQRVESAHYAALVRASAELAVAAHRATNSVEQIKLVEAERMLRLARDGVVAGMRRIPISPDDVYPAHVLPVLQILRARLPDAAVDVDATRSWLTIDARNEL